MKLAKLVCLAGALLLPALSHASIVVFDNTAVSNYDGYPSEFLALVYASFTTGSEPAYISSLQLVVAKSGPTANDVQVGLYASKNGTFNDGGYSGPGPDSSQYLGDIGFIDALTIPALGFEAPVNVDLTEDVDGNPLSPIFLAANTRYWIAANTPSGSPRAKWFYAEDESGTGAATEFNGYVYTDYYVFANAQTPDAGGFKMKVELTAVPEPGTLGAGGMALAGLLIAAHRRKRA